MYRLNNNNGPVNPRIKPSVPVVNSSVAMTEARSKKGVKSEGEGGNGVVKLKLKLKL